MAVSTRNRSSIGVSKDGSSTGSFKTEKLSINFQKNNKYNYPKFLPLQKAKISRAESKTRSGFTTYAEKEAIMAKKQTSA